jgi:methionine synthase I (cobalamin-dependent)
VPPATDELPTVGSSDGLAASTMSHAELDEAEELDAGDPVDLARRYGELRERLPNLNVVGGCCGTDHRHIREICRVWTT